MSETWAPMTDEEIVREYKAAKSPLKQVGILAQLNNCSKERIKEILVAAGCELPAQMRPKAKKAPEAVPDVGMAAKPTTEPEKAEPETEVISVREALPLIVGGCALKVIAELAEKFGDSEDDQFYFRHQVAGVLLLYREIERRCSE